MAQRQIGRVIKSVPSDQGVEDKTKKWQEKLSRCGIVHDLPAPYSLHQNVAVERMDRSLLSLVRAMLRHKHLAEALWLEALCTAKYMKNRDSRSALHRDLSLYYIWSGHSPTLGHLLLFGCKYWYLNMTPPVKILDNKTRAAVSLGYSLKSKAYQLLHADTTKFVLSKEVTFDENG